MFSRLSYRPTQFSLFQQKCADDKYGSINHRAGMGLKTSRCGVFSVWCRGFWSFGAFRGVFSFVSCCFAGLFDSSSDTIWDSGAWLIITNDSWICQCRYLHIVNLIYLKADCWEWYSLCFSYGCPFCVPYNNSCQGCGSMLSKIAHFISIHRNSDLYNIWFIQS